MREAPRLPVAAQAAALVALLALASLLGACSASREAELRRESHFTAACSIAIHDRARPALLDAAFAEAFAALRRTDEAYSMWRPDSELARLNARAGEGPLPASEGLRALLARGLELYRLTGGRYDPTVGPLVRLWGVGTKAARIPSPAEIEAARGLLGAAELRIDEEGGRVELPRAGMEVDFGSLAKGEGAVRAGEALAARGLRSALVDVGGSILVLGSRPDGRAWRVGIQRPGSARGEMLGFVAVRDAVVNTSGTYERWFEAEGRRWNHIVDTATGYPLDNGLLSVTVIRDRRESADGPSLAILVLGLKEGLSLAEGLGLAAILVDAEGGIHLSTLAKPLFTLTDPAYRLLEP